MVANIEEVLQRGEALSSEFKSKCFCHIVFCIKSRFAPFCPQLSTQKPAISLPCPRSIAATPNTSTPAPRTRRWLPSPWSSSPSSSMCVSGGSDGTFNSPDCLKKVKFQLIVETLHLCRLLYKQSHTAVVGCELANISLTARIVREWWW